VGQTSVFLFLSNSKLLKFLEKFLEKVFSKRIAV